MSKHWCAWQHCVQFQSGIKFRRCVVIKAEFILKRKVFFYLFHEAPKWGSKELIFFVIVRSKELKIFDILRAYELKFKPNLGCRAENSSNF